MIALPLAVVVGPLTVLILSIVLIVVTIAWMRLHAFFALFSAAMFVSLTLAAGQVEEGRFVKAINVVMAEFGSATGKIGFTIAIAAVIGMALMESGAADKIIRRLIAVFGEKNAGFALLTCSFILAIPVFFDTVFFLLVPLARALSLRTGKHYLYYILAIAAGGMVTHVTVPPTPGPLLVAETLQINLGLTITVGILLGVPTALTGWVWACWIDRRRPLPLREVAGSSMSTLETAAARREEELPGFTVSIAPVVLPVILITAASIVTALRTNLASNVTEVVSFLGDKNVALLIGAIIALAVQARQKKLGLKEIGGMMGAPLETAGVIILITAAGGAYGAMIAKAGIGEAVGAMVAGRAVNYVLLAWLVAAVVRVAQGSATVAMITASSIMLSIAGGTNGFGVHPIYIFLAVAYGATALSWMNDSGFWVIGRLSGMTEGETLRTWTVLSLIISVVGLIEVWLVSAFWPQLWF